MIITLIIYLLIIGYILLKTFYTFISISIKAFNNNQKIEKFSDSINYFSMPFYIKISQIYLLCIFINLIFLTFISLTLMPDLMNDLIISISNSNITYCQDIDDIRNSNANSRINWDKTIEETYGVFSRNMPIFHELKHFNVDQPYICHLNHFNIEINNYLKVFQGFSQNIENILNKQNNLLQKIFTSSITLNDFKSICENIMERDKNTLDLISRAYDHMMLSYNTKHYSDDLLFKIFDNKTENNKDINYLIRNFISDHQDQVENLNKKTTNVFITLEEVYNISKENSSILNKIIDKPPIGYNGVGDPRINYRMFEEQRTFFYENWNGNQILDDNIPIKRVLNIPEKIKIKNYDELCNYSSKKIGNDFELHGKPIRENYNKDHCFFYIKKNIDDFHKDMFIKKTSSFSTHVEKFGFVFKNISYYYGYEITREVDSDTFLDYQNYPSDNDDY